MKPVDERLNRLMKSASQAPRPAASGGVFGLETRVLAHWRAALRTEAGDSFVTWFRRAAICAGILAMASLAWNYHSVSNRSSVEMVADSAMSMGVEP
jgi:hypothetical protein